MDEDSSYDYKPQSPLVLQEEIYSGYEVIEQQSGYQLPEDEYSTEDLQ